MKFLKLLLFLIPTLYSTNSFAHGVEGKIETFNNIVLISASYDTGEPMSYAKVVIYPPDSKISFQSGKTDRNGHFAFVPDTSGVWKIYISDNLGHKLRLSPTINKPNHDEKVKVNTPSNCLISKKVRIFIGILGIATLFTIIGLAGCCFSKRKKR